MAKRIKLSGHSQLRNENGDALENHVSFEVDGDASTLGADSPCPKHIPPIEVTNPEVARVLSRWVNQMEATAVYRRNRNRPVKSEFKPPRPEPSLDPAMTPDPALGYVFVPCPQCHGEGWYLCQLCDGEGRVTRRVADEWRNA